MSLKKLTSIPIEYILLSVLLIVVMILLGLGMHSIYGRATQENVITFVVIDKEIDTGVTCISSGKTTICTPYTNHYVYSQDSKYLIEAEIYDDVIINKIHSFHTVGWEWDLLIDEILE